MLNHDSSPSSSFAEGTHDISAPIATFTTNAAKPGAQQFAAARCINDAH
jgi:hypothetical protein